MTTDTWTSGNGIVLRDLVPGELRRHWVRLGYCPGQDLYSRFRAQVRDHPQRTAVVDAQRALCYHDLDARVRAIAAGLAETGLGPKDIIGISVPNSWRAVAAELAVAAVGAVALPFPCRRGYREALSLLTRSRATAVITVGGAAATRLVELHAELPFLRTVFVFGAADGERAGCRVLPEGPSEAGARFRACPVDPEAPARILISSGTETEPKMVAYSHNAMAGGRANYVAALHDGTGPMSNLVLVPLASSFGSLGTSVTLAGLGATLLLREGFDAAAALEMITRCRPTHLFGVPTMLRRMAECPSAPGEDTSSLQMVVSSGAALPATTARTCARRFGCAVINVYGSADGVNCHTVGKAASGSGATGWVGVPDPRVTDIRIVDATGRQLPPGRQGEIRARGPMTPLCYVNAPELDARYRTGDGWVRTGDRGLLDQAGRLYVVDRIKQIIVRGGYNISPAEVEDALTAHPLLVEAACVPVADADLGERLCACVVQRPGTRALTLPEINAFLADERGLERPKLPELLVTLPELPLGATGKACRHTLTRLAADACPAPSRSGRTSPGRPGPS
ncbi:MAG TPA: class I adenylate-forming enzyme family protein [Pseudonocardiaceae bacterium]|nr:class I adenylate-forming enzyme family protein [Pseudonocardiaceae bacterium]